ncbi:MAG: alpha-L-fucosidase [Clostridiales bacterium]|jgi:alpha-L-fucosidase|nr:alpha-L-fucosidase [Clostridiales bacterium]
MDIKTFLKNAAHVKPSANQLRFLQETPFYAFVHFSPNTYTNLEWGLGNEDPAIFNPTELDCDSWCEAFLSAGMTGVVLTAKHHDGFCLWQSEYTEHCMKNSPYKNGKGDIVRELSDACRRHGLKFGFYLSPWDRNSKYYGTDEYNTYYKNQLTELLTNYGEIFYVWFDGACGETPDGKKQVYDFEGYFELIRRLQPGTVFFNDAGEIRWCGNEGGNSRFAEWSVVPKELCFYNKNVQTEGSALEGNLSGMYNCDTDIGSLSNILFSKGLVFSPSEIDMSIRPGWFYHENEEPHSLERLFDTYLRSVGGNTTFNLNVPPMPNGRLDERDVERLKQLGDKIRGSFEHELSADAVRSERLYDNQAEYIIKLPEKKQINYIVLRENIAKGQRIESFKVYRKNEHGLQEFSTMGTTVGNRRILKVHFTTDEVRIFVTASRDTADMDYIRLY